MKKKGLSVRYWSLAVALLLGGSTLCPAQDVKPLLTVSLSGYDELISNVEFVGKLGDNPQLAEALKGTEVGLGGQDIHPEEKGAHTGDVSGPQLVDSALGSGLPTASRITCE